MTVPRQHGVCSGPVPRHHHVRSGATASGGGVAPTPDGVLIVDDLLLLLLGDRSGVPAAAGTLVHTLGGAVLADLTLAGRIEAEPGGELSGPVVHAVGDGPLPDPVLQSAYDMIAERPAGVQALHLRIGAALWHRVTYRLVRRGLVRRERRRQLGSLRTTRFRSAGTAYERDLRTRVVAVLDGGGEPDPHLAAVVGLLSADDQRRSTPRVEPEIYDDV